MKYQNKGYFILILFIVIPFFYKLHKKSENNLSFGEWLFSKKGLLKTTIDYIYSRNNSEDKQKENHFKYMYKQYVKTKDKNLLYNLFKSPFYLKERAKIFPQLIEVIEVIKTEKNKF